MLGLVRAEMGRILGMKCEQFSALFDGRTQLEAGSHAEQQTENFLHFYHLLYAAMQGDRAQMNHWLRRHQKALGNSPFYLLVDENGLQRLIDYLAHQT